MEMLAALCIVVSGAAAIWLLLSWARDACDDDRPVQPPIRRPRYCMRRWWDWRE